MYQSLFYFNSGELTLKLKQETIQAESESSMSRNKSFMFFESWRTLPYFDRKLKRKGFLMFISCMIQTEFLTHMNVFYDSDYGSDRDV